MPISPKAITVSRRNYDMSAAMWEGTNTVYDGEKKEVYLIGLPEGVSVKEYIGNGVVNAGLYSVSAVLEYDAENYNEPKISDAILCIEKQVVVIADIESEEYSGELLFPQIEESEFYSYEFSGAVGAGVYKIVFRLKDSDNYSFDSENAEIEKSFEITKRSLSVKLSDIDSYFLGKKTEPSFEIISGELLAQDELDVEYTLGDDYVSASIYAENYDIEVIDGRINRHNWFSPEDSRLVILISIISVVGILALLIILLNRKRLVAYYYRAFSKNDGFIPSMPIMATEEDEITQKREDVELVDPENSRVSIESIVEYSETESEEEERKISEPDEKCEITHESEISDITEENDFSAIAPTVIDAGYADVMISDSLAKDLIRRETEIESAGSKKRIINVDTLSRSFSSGDRVDINLLKKKSLIPYDTGYIKVLARGIIDKPLTVYANDFSLSAVKMIALAGGKSIKAATVSPLRSQSRGNFNKRG